MHDIDYGHDCPLCGKNSICLIEDGFCENGGTCDNCIKESVYNMEGDGENDEWACDYDEEHDFDEECDCDTCQDEKESLKEQGQ
jgi:hypothetical protein